MKPDEKRRAEEAADAVFPMLAELEEPVYHRTLALLAFRKRWRPMRVGLADLLDQLLHLVYAAVVLGPYVIHPSWWTAAIGGFLLGAIREVWQFYNLDLRILMFGERLKDATFFAAGGVVVHFVVQWAK